MTVKALYDAISVRYPASLSAEWDNDGLMCCPDPDREVKRALCTLDVTQEAVEEAARIGADVILSHHPLVFHPLASVTALDPVGRRVVALLAAGISVISLHTRADAAPGGVNDLLCDAVGLLDKRPFGEGLGRIGRLANPVGLSSFAEHIKGVLSAPIVLFGDAGRPVEAVAVVGGSGKGEIEAAIAAGADTLLSGRLSYETVNEAGELGINLLEAGHFYTEALLPRAWAGELLPLYGIEAVYFDSCRVRIAGCGA